MKNQRLVAYLLVGAVLCLGGVVLMFCGMLAKNINTQLAGVIIYAASIPLLFEAKAVKTESRIEALESRMEKQSRATRPSGGDRADG